MEGEDGNGTAEKDIMRRAYWTDLREAKQSPGSEIAAIHTRVATEIKAAPGSKGSYRGCDALPTAVPHVLEVQREGLLRGKRNIAWADTTRRITVLSGSWCVKRCEHCFLFNLSVPLVDNIQHNVIYCNDQQIFERNAEAIKNLYFCTRPVD